MTATDAKTALKKAYLELSNRRSEIEKLERERSEPIAIVGVGCRFPGGADSPAAFWQLLQQATCAVTEIPGERWNAGEFFDPDPATPGKMITRHGAFIDRAYDFDADFFGISPREARHLDPQQRLLLEVSWEALENANLPADRYYRQPVGVFVGITCFDRAILCGKRTENFDRHSGTGSALNMAAGRLSYFFGFTGPSMAVDTACSSSLVCLHQACRSLRSRECDVALAGGVHLILSPEVMVSFSQARLLSPDGRSKTFAASADGYGRGEGCAVVILKRLSDALQSGDAIAAVIKGSAVNQDGPSAGLTVPNGQSQEAVMTRALADAGVEPGDVDYVETHGTGTPLGDPIEVTSLGNVFSPHRDSRRPLMIGSVKTNIGHLESAAGIAGLVKVVLSLQNQTIPAHLHFSQPSPHIPWDTLPLRVPTQNEPWRRGPKKRIAGISSFGFSGTNAHLIVEEPPLAGQLDQPDVAPLSPCVLPLSAKSDRALDELARRYRDHVHDHPDLSPAALCHRASTGRSHFSHRLAIIADSREQLARELDGQCNVARADNGDSTGKLGAAGLSGPRGRTGAYRGTAPDSQPPQIAFLFTGQGSQYPAMGSELYRHEPVFRDTLDRCDDVLRDHLEPSLLQVLFSSDPASSPIHDTRYTQPALFAVEYALARLWMTWGIQPAALLGHSVGEYVAACLAGVFSLDDGLRLVAARGALMSSLPGRGGEAGAMLSVAMGEDRAASLLASFDQLAIAAVNSPDQVVLSGPRDQIDAAAAELSEQGVRVKSLQTSAAFHSPLMRPILDEFESVAATVAYSPPRIRLICNISGTSVGSEIATADYWRRHITASVRFADSVRELLSLGLWHFLEIGPKPTLLPLVAANSTDIKSHRFPSLRPGQPDRASLYRSLGALYSAGADIDWTGVTRGEFAQVSLPNYPFQRSTLRLPHMHDAKSSNPDRSPESRRQPGYYRLDWTAICPPTPAEDTPRNWLVVTPRGRIGRRHQLAETLSRRGHSCDMAWIESDASQPRNSENIARLVRDTPGPAIILFVPSQGAMASGHVSDDPSTASALHEASVQSCMSLLHILRATGASSIPAAVYLVTEGAVVIDGPTVPNGSYGLSELSRAPVLGLARSALLEFPHHFSGTIDLPPDPDESALQALIEYVTARSISARHGDDFVALRDDQWWGLRLAAYQPPDLASTCLSAEATYLITGGLGVLGLRTAGRLIARGARHLVLTSHRSELSTRAKTALEEMDRQGATVRVVPADVTSPADMARLTQTIADQCPPLRGVVHAAGVSGLQNAAELTESQLAAVLRPKVAGSWLLHCHSLNWQLDFFICYSSVASMWGSKGQTHYAAANHFLDMLAHYRRQRGLPAVTINWGPWTGGGMTGPEAEQLLSRLGIPSLSPESALNALDPLLQPEQCGSDAALTTSAAVAIATIDWPVFRQSYELHGPRSILADFALPRTELDETASGQAASAPVLRQLQKGPENERQEQLTTYLQNVVAAILGRDSLPSVDRGLMDMGMDSLMALELRDRLQRDLGCTVPATTAFDYPTIAALSRHLGHDVIDLATVQDNAPNQENTPAMQSLSRSAPNVVPIGLFGAGQRRDRVPEPATESALKAGQPEPIAIIGMSCRFPGGVDSPVAFWSLLESGVDAITEVPPARWNIDEYYDPNPDAPGKMYCRHGGFVDGIDLFEPKFFHISPREAASMDPQQRLLLEVTWEALEHAGKSNQVRGSSTGVFVGMTTSDYAHQFTRACGADGIDGYFFTGNPLNGAAGRLSYVLGFHGPSMTVDTACSSSLVATHLAVQSLRNRECDMALTGGVNLILSPDTSIAVSRTRALAPDGRCKTFDAAANGFVRGEGCGVVVLKRHGDAVRDGDAILAIIRASAVNQDGASSGFTVPNGAAQRDLFRRAFDSIDLRPADVDYIEAHGTGTELGDPIEVSSIADIFADNRPSSRSLLIGSVKTNIGHLEAAAGIAGLIKVVLALQHREIPPHLHFNKPSPHIPWHSYPIAVPVRPTAWTATNKPRVACVDGFGASGTNAHIVVQEAPERHSDTTAWSGPQVLALSAKSSQALTEMMERFSDHLLTHPDLDWHAVCHAVNTGRAQFPHRQAVIATSGREAGQKLAALSRRPVSPAGSSPADEATSRSAGHAAKIAFLFTGQGSQYPMMGHRWYRSNARFRAAIDQCEQILRPLLDKPLTTVLFPDDSSSAGAGQRDDIHDTLYTQPALFAFEYALAEWWQSIGITPHAVLGHSIGEYAAACVAGAVGLDDALHLVAERARLMHALSVRGKMAAVLANPDHFDDRFQAGFETTSEGNPADAFQDHIAAIVRRHADQVSIAAINGPDTIVISGLEPGFTQVLTAIEQSGACATLLRVSHAFHSPAIDPMLDSFERKARTISPQTARIPLISNVTGEVLHSPLDGQYWRRHCRAPVQFARGMQTLLDKGYRLFLEVGPRPVLSRLGKNIVGKRHGKPRGPADDPCPAFVHTLATGRDDRGELVHSLAALYRQGAAIDWQAYHGPGPDSRPWLPTYPFQRRRCWFEEKDTTMQHPAPDTDRSSNSARPSPGENASDDTNPHSANRAENANHDGAAGAGRRERISATIRDQIAALLQAEPADIEIGAPFLEMGADSIVMMEAIQRIQSQFGIKLAIRQLFETLTNIEQLSEYLDTHLVPDCPWALADTNRGQQTGKPDEIPGRTEISAHAQEVPGPAAPEAPEAPGPGAIGNSAPVALRTPSDRPISTPSSDLERVIVEQNRTMARIMSQQLDLLGNAKRLPAVAQTTDTAQTTPKEPEPEPPRPDATSTAGSGQRKLDNSSALTTAPMPWGNPAEIRARGLTARQTKHLEALIERYVARTRRSKQLASQSRAYLADSRAAVGFRFSTKEMLYPISGARTHGSRMWDVDGNQYVDFTMGFGVHLFGHCPDFSTLPPP